MRRMALIRNGIVDNVIVVEDDATDFLQAAAETGYLDQFEKCEPLEPGAKVAPGWSATVKNGSLEIKAPVTLDEKNKG